METLLELFHCRRQNMRLTAGGCSRLWLSAQSKENEPKPWEGRSNCVTCPIGAANSGRVISPVAEEVAALIKVCPRCLRLARRLVNGCRCVSCYNRHAEAEKGKNAKGNVPALRAQLRDVDAAVTGKAMGGRGINIIHHEGVTGAVEVIVRRARQAKDVTYFGWSAAGPGSIEAIML